VLKPVSSLAPVNLLSLCFGYCITLVQWDCNKCNVTKVLNKEQFDFKRVYKTHDDRDLDRTTPRQRPSSTYSALSKPATYVLYSPQALARPVLAPSGLTHVTDLLALFAGVASTTPVAARTVTTALATSSSATKLVVSGDATPAPTQSLVHVLGGSAAPSRHMPAVSAAIATLAKSPGQGLIGTKAPTPG